MLEIRGGEGADTLVGTDGDDLFTITGAGSGAINGFTFAGIENLVAGSGNDTLVGPSGDTIWNVTGPGSGKVAGVSFTGIENLSGAADNQDTFVFTQAGSISGLVEGGYGGFDSLEFNGGTFDTVQFDAYGPDSGMIQHDSRVTFYSGMEPITDNNNASTRIFTFTGGPENITLSDDSTPNDNISKISSSLSESVTFTTPSISLTINSGTGNDTIILSGLDAQFNAALIVNGDGGSDTVNMPNVLPTLTELSITAESIAIGRSVNIRQPAVRRAGNFGRTHRPNRCGLIQQHGRRRYQ
jgi:hypothetical protein